MPVRKDVAPGNDPTEPTVPPAPEVQPEQPVDEPAPAVDATGYHDSVSGRPLDKDGRFLDANDDEGPVEAHRIVADNWPEVNR